MKNRFYSYAFILALCAGSTAAFGDDAKAGMFSKAEPRMSQSELSKLSNMKAKNSKSSLFSSSKARPEKKEVGVASRKLNAMEFGNKP